MRLKNLSARLVIQCAVCVLAALLAYLPATSSLAEQDRQLVQNNASNSTSVRRLALVIGNGAYTSAPPLKNPPNDARDMAAALKLLGFTVASAIDSDQRTMKRLIREFGQQLKAGGQGLFYYAGHGVQLRGRNYLIPANAEINSEADVEDQGVDLNFVLGLMDEAQNGLNIVVLDACRNNPFARSFRSANSGLAQVDAPTGTLIAYATAPGRVASDGQGRNGLYTAELLAQMQVPGIGVEEVFKRVRAGVQRKTNSGQVPWESSSLVGNFYFTAPAGSTGAATAGNISEGAREQALWEVVKDSNEPQDFKDYLTKYPNGAYADAANIKLRRLEAARKGTEKSEAKSPGNSVPSQPKLTTSWEYLQAGNTLAKQQNWADAERSYREALRLGESAKAKGTFWPSDEIAIVKELAQAMVKQNNTSGATAEFKTLLQRMPNEAGAHFYFAMFLEDQKLLSEAAAEHREAVRVKPDDTMYFQSLVSFLERQNMLDEAETEYRALVARSRGKSYEAWSHSAYGNFLLFKRNNLKDAERETQLAIRLASPQDANLNFYRSQLQMIKNRKK